MMSYNFREIAEKYNQNFGFKVIPVINKKPVIDWKEYQNREQNLADINSIHWNNRTNGIAIIHNGKFVALDFDRCRDESFVYQIAKELNVNSWIVKTGNGFHIHLELDDSNQLYKVIGKQSAYYILKPINRDLLKHLEIRVNNCYTVLPGSLHNSGTEYKFISGTPGEKPNKVKVDLLIEVLKKYFLFSEFTERRENQSNIEILLDGVFEGQRQKALVTLFGVYFNQGFSENLILKHLELWNAKNNPPFENDYLKKHIAYLWKRYSKGLDGVYHQFQNCLLALIDPPELKLKKILCYSVKEFGSEDRLIHQLGLDDKLNDYYSECRKFIDEYIKLSQRKDQIIRIGEKMILSVLKGELEYYLFSVYCGIVSFLGRGNKAAKRISNNIIAYRALGYKTELDYSMSETPQKPLSKYMIRKAVTKLEKLDFIRTFKLRRAEMSYYSTKIDSKENLASYVVTIQKNRFKKRIDEEKLRHDKLEELNMYELGYLELLKGNKKRGLSITPILINSNMKA